MTPAMFHIALALADGPRHGYGLMRDVELLSRGTTHLGPARCIGRSSACVWSR